MPITIKPITQVTQPILWAMHGYLKQNKISRERPLCKNKISAMVTNMTKNPLYRLWVAFDGDLPVGFVCGQIQESLFHDTRLVFDLGYFVLPQYQGQGIGKQLIQHLIQWAQDEQASAVHFCVSFAGEASDRANVEKMAGMGFEVWGQMTRKTLTTAPAATEPEEAG